MSINLRNIGEWRGKVIYHIFIDRFAGLSHPENHMKNDFCGGNIRGIIEKFNYIKSLGVNAILLSPFYQGSAYHGYHITDFYKVDPRFGSETDLQELINLSHASGIKVLIDFVPNHMSWKHPFLQDAVRHKKSPYREWFFFNNLGQYTRFLNFKELAKINLDYQPAMEYVRDSAHKWLNMGVDGMRIDHVIGLSNQNVSELLEPLRVDFPKAIFFGEPVVDKGFSIKEMSTLRVPHKYRVCFLRKFSYRANELLLKNYIGLLEGVLDFVQETDFEKYAKRQLSTRRVLEQSSLLGRNILQFSFLDCHDEERFLFRVKNDKQKLLRATEELFKLDQPKIIYYGTEIGMTQTKKFDKHGKYQDLLVRQPMIWDPREQDSELLDKFKRLVAQANHQPSKND